MNGSMERIGKAGAALGFIGAAIAVLAFGVFVISGMVVVENRRAAVLIRKTGDDLPGGEILFLAAERSNSANLARVRGVVDRPLQALKIEEGSTNRRPGPPQPGVEQWQP
jgi:hypothetical protein